MDQSFFKSVGFVGQWLFFVMDKTPQASVFDFEHDNDSEKNTPISAITPVTSVTSDVRKRLNLNDSIPSKKIRSNSMEKTPKTRCSNNVKPRGSLSIRNLNFTPHSHNRKSSLSSAVATPTSGKLPEARKRLDLYDETLSNEAEKALFLAQLRKIQILPNCLCAIGCLLNEGVHSDNSRSTVLKDMPDFFGYYRGSNCIKSFDRIRKNLCSLDGKIRSAAFELYNLNFEKHISLTGFKKDEQCKICFASEEEQDNKIGDQIDFSVIRKSLEQYYEQQINTVDNPSDIYDQIACLNDSIFNKYLDGKNYVQEPGSSTKESINNLIAEGKRIEENSKIIQKNLDSHATELYYASPIAHRQLSMLDKKLFCKPKLVMSVEKIAELLPSANTVRLSNPDVDFESLFSEYEASIKEFGHEKKGIFYTLGEKYNLKGPRGGKFRQNFIAQSIVLDSIRKIGADIKDDDRYSNLVTEFTRGHKRRARFEQFDINGDVVYPRLPKKIVAEKHLDQLVKDKVILLGESQGCEKISSTDPVTGEITTIEIAARKVSFDDLRETSLKKHKKYLRAKEPLFYKNLTKTTILQMLDEYGVLDKHHVSMELEQLQKLVQKLETTRTIAIWYDHATIGNRSHALFTFMIIYNKATYICPPGMDIDDMQKYIETPQTYTLCMSRSTTDGERSFDDMRLDDILSLSDPIIVEGIVFNDKFRMTIGDNPVRCSETGQNKSGRYRLCSLPVAMEEFHSFAELISFRHLSIKDKREIACRGNYFDDSEESSSVNLQHINSIEYCRNAKISAVDSKDAAAKHEKALCGIKSTPAMLSKHPYTELSLLNLDQWEVLPMEVLHDLKGTVKKSFEFIPGSIHLSDDNVIKSIHSIVHKSGDELYLLKDKHSAESLARALTDICRDLQRKFFPHGLDAPCIDCGHLFTVSKKFKCVKCSLVGYYRALCEIQLYGYKHESKRTAYDCIRLHNLIFLLFYFITCLEKSLPRFKSDSVIRCSHFVNTIFYLPIVFELHNTISFNAGRHEDMFRQIKIIATNLTNHHHTSPQLLLNLFKRIECNRLYNVNPHSERSSQYSKQMNYFLKQFPRPPIRYTKDFIEESIDFHAFFQRISTFLVDHTEDKFASVNSNLLIFDYKSCDCNSYSCSICTNKKFPAFGINNILVSNISKIFDVKESVFNEHIKPHIFDSNNKLVYQSLVRLINGEKDSLVPCQHLKMSDEIIAKASIAKFNNAQVELPKTFKNVVLQLPEIKHRDYKKLKNSFLVQCLAKIYGTVDDDLIIFDRVVGSLESIQKQFRNKLDALKRSETYHEALRKYVSFIRKHIHRLNSYVKHLRKEIQSTGLEIDNKFSTVCDDETDENPCDRNLTLDTKSLTEKLTGLQKRLLAFRFTVQCFVSESNTHSNIMTEFDDGIFE